MLIGCFSFSRILVFLHVVVPQRFTKTWPMLFRKDIFNKIVISSSKIKPLDF